MEAAPLDLRVLLPVWLAVGCWMGGALARLHSGTTTRFYAGLWFAGALLIWVHILASYAWVHDWSHTAALAATARDSERVTGIRASWGVYVNFAFAGLWLAYAGAMLFCGRRIRVLDSVVFWITAAIVFSATVVFESGWVRAASLAGFIVLACAALVGNARAAKGRHRQQQV